MERSSPVPDMSSKRQRLKPWLWAQVESERFPGLVWVNKEERTFKMTWKHGRRSDWSEQDALIFKVSKF